MEFPVYINGVFLYCVDESDRCIRNDGKGEFILVLAFENEREMERDRYCNTLRINKVDRIGGLGSVFELIDPRWVAKESPYGNFVCKNDDPEVLDIYVPLEEGHTRTYVCIGGPNDGEEICVDTNCNSVSFQIEALINGNRLTYHYRMVGDRLIYGGRGKAVSV